MDEMRRPGLTRLLAIALLIFLIVAGFLVLVFGSQKENPAPGTSNTGVRSGVNKDTPVEKITVP